MKVNNLENENSNKKYSYIKSGNFYELFWIFILGSMAGAVFEFVWGVVVRNDWNFYSSTVWGYFTVIYGFGAICISVIYRFIKDKHVVYQFFVYLIGGTAVEFICGIFQEKFFGSVSWDYSETPLNIGGRICLGMALVWGILGIGFARFVYVPLSNALTRLNGKTGYIFTVCMLIFMVLNLIMTFIALDRWQDRVEGIAAKNKFEEVVDRIYNDERMENTYRIDFINSEEK